MLLKNFRLLFIVMSIMSSQEFSLTIFASTLKFLTKFFSILLDVNCKTFP